MKTAEALLTAEEFGRLQDDGSHRELVRGRIVTMNMPVPRHGEICGNTHLLIGPHVRDHELGRLLINDSGVITERRPDTVRGADLAFYSYARVPRGPLPQGYLSVVPELVIEVRSPGDRWSRLLRKVSEYLDAGVSYVCVLDQQTESLHIYSADEPVRILTSDDEFTLPEILGDFRCKVARFFE
jgi:Uma2 family endonuclease